MLIANFFREFGTKTSFVSTVVPFYETKKPKKYKKVIVKTKSQLRTQPKYCVASACEAPGPRRKHGKTSA